MSVVAAISQSALVHNLSIVKQLAPQVKIVAMVKSNAYGHHLDLVMPLIENADILAVSDLIEARALRKISNSPILILSGVYSPKQRQTAINLACKVVVHHYSQISLISRTTLPLSVWIKIDTGMHRLGLSKNEYNQCLLDFKANPLINIECVMSHFSCANDITHSMNQMQLSTFKTLTDAKYQRSMANSAAILTNPCANFEFIRPGIMLYGISPFFKNFNLQPVMQLSALVISIKTIQAGDSVGYGALWVAKAETTLAIIDIGYGHGYPRQAKNGTPVLINNTLCPLVGCVSMEMIVVDISGVPVCIGDKAILWGDKKLRVETIAQYSNVIANELLTQVSNRVKFSVSE